MREMESESGLVKCGSKEYHSKTISTKEFKELIYIDKLNVYEQMTRDFFLCHRANEGEFQGWVINSIEDLNTCLVYIRREKLDSFDVNPKSIIQYSQLINWMLEREHYSELLDYTRFDSHIAELNKRLAKSQFPAEIIEEVKEKVSKEYQSIRSRVIDVNRLRTQPETYALFLRLGVEAHREGFLGEEKYNHLLEKLSEYELKFSESFTFVGIMKAFNIFLTGYSFSELYQYVTTDCNLSIVTPPPPTKKGKPSELDENQRKAMQLVVTRLKEGKSITTAMNNVVRQGFYSKSGIEKLIRQIRNEWYEYDLFKDVDPKRDKYYLTSKK
jgi:hypothetical protein